jgi:ATP-dependent DNA helicase RecG
VVLNSTWIDPETAKLLAPAPGWQDILAALRQVGQLRTGEVEQILGVTRPTALKRLRAIERVGLIRWIGQNEYDPNAYWELAEDESS